MVMGHPRRECPQPTWAINPPHLCRIAVFSIKPTFSLSITGGVEGLMQKSYSNTIMGRVKAGEAGEAAGRCRRTGPKP